MDKPKFIMMVGLPYSGKSTFAEQFKNDFIIHSSDKLRKELFGDENNQKYNAELFKELHMRIKEDLKAKHNVIFDATNLNKKKRITFLQELKNIPCYKECVLCLLPYEDCFTRMVYRKRKVPTEVIYNMYKNFQPPHKSEGFDKITLYLNFDDTEESFLSYYNSTFFYSEAIDFNQDNSHHTLTLGEHCIKSAKYIKEHYPEREDLFLASFYHDQGKMITKSATNSKGEMDGDFHYYQHHCCGAYDSFFYLYNYGCSTEDIIYISNLIYYHMHPYLSWKQSNKAMERDKKLLGEDMFKDILSLHEADLYAH